MGDGTKLDEEFTVTAKALDEIEHRLPFITDKNELGEVLCEAVELGNRVTALQARVALAARVNGVASVNGQRSIGQYVAARTNHRSFETDRLCRLTRWLRDFPIFETAFGAELTQPHIEYLRKHLDGNYDTHRKLVADQQFFVDTAATCSFEGFTTACDYWLAHIDPDGKEPTDQIEKTSFRVGKGQGGRGELSGVCDAVDAQDLRTAINHEAEKLRRQDKENGVERTTSQRRMAALTELVKRGFARQDGTYPVPLGGIVMSQQVAEWAINTLTGQPENTNEFDPRVPVHPTDVDGRM